ncbi:dehydrogenase [Streptomyces sp. WAC 01529]|uniref:NAD(P)-dependent oxidoreductase n=1 Tax=Streptomyces sp. WAC 01529 TaxID=2203205 RepID=UPI000F6BC34C|nr:NAD(P)-binding domain-containing protein [Streptomyces sp. WAC 01529]AZM57909.1 dehydrogenase [Streptomyces sp. WAC 01529]
MTEPEPRYPLPASLPTVTVLGLGSMGQALAGAFLGAGHPTTVWNRSPGKGDELVARGASRAATPADAVRAGEVVVVCVLDYDAARTILDQVTAADLAGRVLVNLTSDTPERAREAAARAAELGVDYLDGAVMVPVPMIGTPDALIFHSGSRSAYEKYEATLKALGGQSAYVGEDHGLAAVFDLSVLDFFWTAMHGLVHGFALAARDGVKAAALVPFLKANVALVESAVEHTAADIDAGTYPGVMDNLAMEAEGIEHIVHAAEHRGLDAGALRGVLAAARRAVDLGHGADTWTSTIEGIRSPA